MSEVHYFRIADAKNYGLVESVMLQNFRHWIGHNQANGTHFYDGRTWTYNSVKAFGAHFPYLTGNQIRRCIESLIAKGVLVRGNYNQSTYDKTSWFAFSDESFSLIDLANLPNGIGKSATSHTNSKHTLKTQIGEKKAQAPSSFVLPDWINQSHWDAWHSCDKRKKATDAQKQLAIDKLAKWREAGIDHAEALENAAIGGWQGLFKPDDKKPAVITGNRQPESFAERDARNSRERWEAMTGRTWPADELPGAAKAAPMFIDVDTTEIKRLSK